MQTYVEYLITFNEKHIEKICFDIPILIKQYLVLKLEIVISLFIVSTVLIIILKTNLKWYDRIKYRLANRPLFLVRVYKLSIILENMLTSVRPFSLQTYYGSHRKRLIDTVYTDGLIKRIIKCIISCFDLRDFSTLLALTATLILYYYNSIHSLFKYFVTLNIDSLLSKATLLSPIIIIIIIFISWKYTSVNGRYTRGVSRLNQKIIEETLDIHRRLIDPIVGILIKGADNIEKVIEHRELLINSKLENISPYISSIKEKSIIWDNKLVYDYKIVFNKEDLIFKSIEEVDSVCNIIEDARRKI